MSDRAFRFPLSILISQAGRLGDALGDATVGPPVAARLPATFAAEFGALLAKVSGGGATKAGQAGGAGQLTQAQTAAFAELERLMGAARRSAALAFPGQDVLLREEFQRGIDTPQSLAAVLERARIIAASCAKYAAELAAHGWIAQDTADLGDAITALEGANLSQESALDVGPGITAARTADANALYKKCLSLQNAARLAFPSTRPDTATARARYLLDEFPPRDGNGGAELPAAPATPTA